jgi:hypothetical protein
VGRGVQVQEDRSGPRDSAADVKRNNNGGCVKCSWDIKVNRADGL